MTSLEKYQEAVRLLKEINCPEPIMDALYVFGWAVESDERKRLNWLALTEGLRPAVKENTPPLVLKSGKE